jgi:hypothetical protein
MSVRDIAIVIAPEVIRSCMIEPVVTRGTNQDIAELIVRLAIEIEKQIADHELKEITPPAKYDNNEFSQGK